MQYDKSLVAHKLLRWDKFITDYHLPELISADGIHLTMPGYRQLFDTLAQWVVPQLA